MNKRRFVYKTLKTVLVFFLITVLTTTPIIPAFNNPLTPKQTNACTRGGSGGARVGGVALDQAATFLANMDDLSGAYYDETKDRIVFVGRSNTSLPEFDKDDLAVAIKAVIFYKMVPQLSIENDPNNPEGPYQQVLYYGGIHDTKFGQVLLDADYKMKKYEIGYDENQQVVTSSVPGYKSFINRYFEKPNADPITYPSNAVRFWLTPLVMSLKQDEASNSFVFDQTMMQVKTEPKMNNDPAFDEAAQDFAQHHTENYDAFAQETPSYAEAKKLGKITSVIKWLSDNGIATDFRWAYDYAPKYVPTVREMPRIITPSIPTQWGNFTVSGGADYKTPNTYSQDNGTSTALKTSSEAVNAPKEDIHWTFTENNQNYDAVAVAADAFRSLGSYNTSVTDMGFDTCGEAELSFTRSYSSFSGGQFGIGRGWSFLPAQLVDNRPTADSIGMSFCTGQNLYKRQKLAFQANGMNETYTFNAGGCIYLPDDNAYHSKITTTYPNSTTTLYHVKTKDQISYTFEERYPLSLNLYSLRLKEIQDKTGTKVNYNYDSQNRLTSISDDRSHSITISYNSNNLINKITDWANTEVNYSYDTQGNLLTVTDPRNNVTTYTYDTNNKLATIENREDTIVVTNTYTPEAKLSTQQSAANVTDTYVYDDVNRKITRTDSLNRTEETTYDTKSRILTLKDPLNHTTTYTYGAEFSPLTVTDKNNKTRTNTYDLKGNLITVTDPNNKTITLDYDSEDRLTEVSDARYTPAKITENTYDGSGNLIEIDENGRVTSFTYDQWGEMLTQTDPRNHTTTWTRDTFGNPLTELNANNNTTTFEYDALGRLKKKIDASTRTEEYTYDANGNLLTILNAIGTTTNVYDKENRLKETTLPNNSVTEFTYNNSGSLTTVEDALDNITTYTYDSYQNLLTQQNALLDTTSHEYDVMNRRIETTTPLSKVSSWEHDANGNITKRIDANDEDTLYEYDALNRLKKIIYPNLDTVTYTYDDRGNLTQMVDPVGTSTYAYDLHDRLLTATNPYNQQITYTYDATNNITKIKYPDNKEVNYTYDNVNQLSEVADWNASATDYTYHNNGLLATRTFPNGIVSSYVYDNANRLSSLTHTKDSTILAKFAYERDEVGNITKVTEEGTLLPPPPGPDLVITEVSTTPTTPAANTPFDVNIKIKNQGEVATGVIIPVTGYYTDPAEPPTYATSPNKTKGVNFDLDPGEEVTVTKDNFEFSTTGTHYIWVIADRQQQVTEMDETNNVYGPFAVQIQAPAPTATPTPTPTPGAGTSLVQKKFGYQATNANVKSFTSNVTSGNTIIAAVTHSSDSVSGITDNRGNTYTEIVSGGKANADGDRVHLYYAKNVTGGATTITVNFTDSTDTAVGIYEYAGLDTNAPLDKTTSATGTGTAPTGGTLATTIDNELYFAAGVDDDGNDGVPAAGSGYTLLDHYDEAMDVRYYTEGKVAGSGSHATNFSIANSGSTWAVIGASFKPATAGGPTSTPTPTNTPTPTPTPTNTPTPTSTPTPTPTPGAGKDLIVTGITLSPATVEADEAFDIQATIKNQGSTTTGSTSFKIGYYYDRSSTPTASSYDDTETNSTALAGGATRVITETSVEFDDPGSHNIWVIVDRENTIGETNESNNVYGPFNVNVIASAGFANKFMASLGLANIQSLFTIPSAFAQTSLPQYVTTFTYDALSRVTQAKYHDEKQYDFVYNSIDNRTALTASISGTTSATNYTYDADSRLTQAGSETFTYDDNGNQTAIANSTRSAAFDFNHENRLVQHDPTTGDTSSYVYDGNNNRLAKTVGTTTTRFVNDISSDLENVLVETNTSNVISNYYVYGVGIVSQGGAPVNSREYLLEDGEGNIRLVMDENGNKIHYYTYQPYGGMRSTNLQNDTMLYQGQQIDTESGLYHLRARQYDPSTGRFISKDPQEGALNMPQSQNPYAYALNNPVIHNDPSGEIAPIVVMAGIGAVAGGVSTLIENPDASWQEVGMGAAIGAGSSVVGFGVAGVATSALASTAISAGARSVIANGIGGAVEGVGSSMANGNTANEVLADGLVGFAAGKIGTAAVPFRGAEPGFSQALTGSYVGKNTTRLYNQQANSEAAGLAWQAAKNCLQ